MHLPGDREIDREAAGELHRGPSSSRTPSANLIHVPGDLLDRQGRIRAARPRGRFSTLGARAGRDEIPRSRPARRRWRARLPWPTPRRVSSASPRVITADRVLSPTPSPSPMPVAIAITFLRGPRNLAAHDVRGWYRRGNTPQWKSDWELSGELGILDGDHTRGGKTRHDLPRQIRGRDKAPARCSGRDLADDLGPSAGGSPARVPSQGSRRGHPGGEYASRPLRASRACHGRGMPITSTSRLLDRLLERSGGAQLRRQPMLREVGPRSDARG